MDLMLTFDLGTTSVKTCLFDRELRLLGSSTREYQVLTPGSGIVELPAHIYWDNVADGAKEAARNAGRSLSDVQAVSVSTQGETLIPVDQEGAPLHNAVIWLDERAGKEASQLSIHFPPETFYFHTGIPECTGYCPVSKLLWFKNQRPDIYEKTYKFLLLEDFILQRLTGRFVTEKSLLCTTGYFDIGTDRLWDEIFEKAELDQAKIPELLECGTVVGRVLPQVAEELGLSPEAVAVTAAMDQTAAAVGAGNLTSGIITETTGTALCIGATSDHPDMAHSARLCVYRHICPGRYLLLPTCMTAGMVLKWFKDAFCTEEIWMAKETGRSVYALLDDIVEHTTPGANGLTLLPYFTGIIQPDNDPNARGVFFGVGLNTGKPEFLRAIFEGIAYMLRENVALIEQVSGAPVTAIRSLGGGSRSQVWRQIKADVCGVEIDSMEQEECTSLGAAILSAVALGIYPDALSAAAVGNRVKDRLFPESLLQSVYDKGFVRYQRVWKHARIVFDGE